MGSGRTVTINTQLRAAMVENNDSRVLYLNLVIMLLTTRRLHLHMVVWVTRTLFTLTEAA